VLRIRISFMQIWIRLFSFIRIRIQLQTLKLYCELNGVIVSLHASIESFHDPRMNLHGSRVSVYGSIASRHSSGLFTLMLIRIRPLLLCESGLHFDLDPASHLMLNPQQWH
jgi:hypothetical protein